jgi:hypothetical protein
VLPPKPQAQPIVTSSLSPWFQLSTITCRQSLNKGGSYSCSTTKSGVDTYTEKQQLFIAKHGQSEQSLTLSSCQTRVSMTWPSKKIASQSIEQIAYMAEVNRAHADQNAAL